MHRRAAILAALAPVAAHAASESFQQFLTGVRRDARAQGIGQATLDRALAGISPNQRVLELDRRQATGRPDWSVYRNRYLTPDRLQAGRNAYREVGGLLTRIEQQFRVNRRVIMGIWGAETNFGSYTGGMNVIEALATLAWDGRRGAYFRTELMAALKILDQGHITPDRMKGSWAGALGQPQFMPTNFFRLAVDFDGDGRRDIWDSRADALASIANYLQRSGWRWNESWGFEVSPTAYLDAGLTGKERARPMADWMRLGVRAKGGGALPAGGPAAELVIPEGGNGQTFLVLPNFHVIRRYNTPYFYALAVGMIGDLVTA